MKIYDLAVVGAGLAGATAAIIAAEAGLETLVLERGCGPKDRHDLAEGWLGRALYTMPRLDVGNLTKMDVFGAAIDLCRSASGGWLERHEGREVLASENLPLCSKSAIYYRASPECGHELAQRLYRRLMATNGKADALFNTEVERLEHKRDKFILHTTRGQLEARRCLLATGAFSAPWLDSVCGMLDLKFGSPRVRLGVRVEVPARLEAFRRFLRVMDDLCLVDDGGGQLEDLRVDSRIGDREGGGILSAFAHTIAGSQPERTSFMAGFDVEGGFAEAARIAKITNILANDKIRRERAADFVHRRGISEHLGQFDPVRRALQNLDRMVPSFLSFATVHIPEMRVWGALPTDEKMRTAFPGLYGAGECLEKVDGLLDAMASALVSAQSIMEE